MAIQLCAVKERLAESDALVQKLRLENRALKAALRRRTMGEVVLWTLRAPPLPCKVQRCATEVRGGLALEDGVRASPPATDVEEKLVEGKFEEKLVEDVEEKLVESSPAKLSSTTPEGELSQETRSEDAPTTSSEAPRTNPEGAPKLAEDSPTTTAQARSTTEEAHGGTGGVGDADAALDVFARWQRPRPDSSGGREMRRLQQMDVIATRLHRELQSSCVASSPGASAPAGPRPPCRPLGSCTGATSRAPSALSEAQAAEMQRQVQLLRHRFELRRGAR